MQTIVLSKLIRDLKRNHLLYLLPSLVYHFPGNDITELVCHCGIQLAQTILRLFRTLLVAGRILRRTEIKEAENIVSVECGDTRKLGDRRIKITKAAISKP